MVLDILRINEVRQKIRWRYLKSHAGLLARRLNSTDVREVKTAFYEGFAARTGFQRKVVGICQHSGTKLMMKMKSGKL